MMQGTHNEKRERERETEEGRERIIGKWNQLSDFISWPFGTTSMIALPEGSETKRGT